MGFQPTLTIQLDLVSKTQHDTNTCPLMATDAMADPGGRAGTVGPTLQVGDLGIRGASCCPCWQQPPELGLWGHRPRADPGSATILNAPVRGTGAALGGATPDPACSTLGQHLAHLEC